VSGGWLPPFAHAGHWALWVLYAVPVIVVLGSIIVSLRRERRQAPDPERSDDS
jgi:cytochrome c-type biogenesis protein CcmH/NrfF